MIPRILDWVGKFQERLSRGQQDVLAHSTRHQEPDRVTGDRWPVGEVQSMGLAQLMTRRWIVPISILLILVSLAIWTIRPPLSRPWLGPAGLGNGTPLAILEAWIDG